MDRLLVVAGLALAPGPIAGQQAEPPAFPIRTEVVILDMVVRDERGQPVTDLRAQELVVLEDGVKCPLQSLRLVRAELPAGKGPPASTPTDAASARATETTRSGGTAGGRGPESPLRPNIVILAFDRLGLEAAGVARRAAVDFARRPFPLQTWFAVYEIGDHVRVRQGITSDATRLLPAIELATAGTGRPHEPGTTPESGTLTKQALSASLLALRDPTGVNAVDPVLSARTRQSTGPAEQRQREVEAQMGRLEDSLSRQRLGGSVLHALLAIARELSGLRGRKTLLLFSEGLHVPGALTDVLETVVSEANLSNLAVYAVDPRGLLAGDSFEDSKLGLLAARGYSEKAQRRKDPATQAREETSAPEREQDVRPVEVQTHEIAEDALRMNTQANLRELSEATGGFLVANSNDLSSGIERIGADLRSYYELAYYPANPIGDGTFRAIEVKVARPKLRIRTRRGYFARAADARPTLLPYELALAQAFDLPVPPRDFAHRVTTQVVGGSPERSEVHLAVQVPLGALRFEYDDAERSYRAHFSILVLVRTRDQDVVSRLSHDWPIQGPLTEAPLVRNQSATVKRTLVLAPGEYSLESAVADRLGGGLSVLREVVLVASAERVASP
jgi:VWFA-related protein